jgi:hypothetical protein
MIAIAIMNAADTIANAMFCFSIISFQIFSGVTFSKIQKQTPRMKIPTREKTTDAVTYFHSIVYKVKSFMIS